MNARAICSRSPVRRGKQCLALSMSGKTKFPLFGLNVCRVRCYLTVCMFIHWACVCVCGCRVSMKCLVNYSCGRTPKCALLRALFFVQLFFMLARTYANFSHIYFVFIVAPFYPPLVSWIPFDKHTHTIDNQKTNKLQWNGKFIMCILRHTEAESEI